MRFFLELKYKGTRYRGWQRQLKVRSVQETLENALSQIFKYSIRCHGCGRTDAGVHASQFFAHFYQEEAPEFNVVERLNYTLPPDIRIVQCFRVPNNFNVQKSALSRTYIYKIHTQEDPFLREISTYYNFDQIDFDLLEYGAACILRASDFKALCKKPELVKTTICHVTVSEWHAFEKRGQFEYVVQSNRFLQGMVRLLVGTMLEMAAGRITTEDFERHLYEQLPLPIYQAAYPQGLYLAGVSYPEF